MNQKQYNEAYQRYSMDLELFAREQLVIQTKDGELVPFVFNRIQSFLWKNLILPALREGRPIRWIILKARQMGLSTFIAAIAAWLIFLRKNRNGIVSAHDEEGSENIFEKIQLMYRMLPSWLQAQTKINNRGKIYLTNPDPKGDPGMESRILVQPAANTNIGRSFALHFFHGSEVAFWKEIKKLLLSVKQAMPKRIPGTFMFLESTANGPNYFMTLWYEARDRGYTPVFISWVAFDEYTDYEASESYLLGLEEDLYDIEDDLFGNEIIEREAVIEELKFWYPEESQSETWLAMESLRRLSWRRTMIVQECESDLELFRQEYPTTPDDAFATTGSSVFPSKKLKDIEKELRMPTRAKFKRYRWKDRAWVEAKYGELRVYRPLDPKGTYVIGVDTSLGIEGGDPAAIVMLKYPDMTIDAVYDKVEDPDTVAEIIYDLGMQANEAFVIVERNEEGGARINDLLWDWRYPSLYRRETDDSIDDATLRKIGWKTTNRTKPMMIALAKEMIRNDEIVFWDRKLVDQLIKYRKNTDGSFGVPPPGNDDIAIAFMLALIALESKQFEAKIRRDTARSVGPGGKVPKYSLKWWEKKLDSGRERF